MWILIPYVRIRLLWICLWFCHGSAIVSISLRVFNPRVCSGWCPTLLNFSKMNRAQPTVRMRRAAKDNIDQKLQQEPDPSSFLSTVDILSFPTPSHPLLGEALPFMTEFFGQYGHANVPLGNLHGRRCSTLRRLHHAGKLSPTDHFILSSLNFRFDEFRFDPDTIDISDLLSRLLEYNALTNADFQIPKKYAPDPQLGAFVAYVRRIGRDDLKYSLTEALDSVGFVWKSTRKCGSSFLTTMRKIRETYIEREKKLEEGVAQPQLDEEQIKWVRAQAGLFRIGKLNEIRVGYMDELPFNWKSYGKDIN